MNRFGKKVTSIAAMVALGSAAGSSPAAVLINEIYFNAPSNSTESRTQYIELRGAAGESLNNTYLIALENERPLDNSGTAGVIEHIFNLNGRTIGSNGYTVLLPFQSVFTGAIAPNAGSSVFQNISGTGWGDSSTGFAHQGGSTFEGSGSTFMIVKVNSGAAPALDDDLDEENDGVLDNSNGRSNWTILDSIGVLGEIGDATPEQPLGEESHSALYGKVNFAPGTLDYTPANGYVSTDSGSPGFSEIEYIARFGDSTGQTPSDWVAANLTDNAAVGVDGGYTNAKRNYGVSGTHGNPGSNPEIYRGTQAGALPYGTDMTTSLGSVNVPGPLFAAPVLIDDVPGSGTSHGSVAVLGNPATDSYQIGEVNTPEGSAGLTGYIEVTSSLANAPGDAPVYVLLDINGDGNSSLADANLRTYLNNVVGRAYTAYILGDDASGVLAAYQNGVAGDYDVVLKFAAASVPPGDGSFFFKYDLGTPDISALGVNSLSYVGVVPEPGSLSLLGIASLAMLRRRRSKNA